jgi:YegS/Rv2252/BmrU family lipid kinase
LFSFLLDYRFVARQKRSVRTCVIFNPVARGEKAKRFKRHLELIGQQSTLKLTAAAGDARRLAAEAVKEGFEIIVAAGGDGTLNEVLNGIGDMSEGFERTRLGVLPLGTVNVFARELALPTRLEAAWEVIRQGHETIIDLPNVTTDGTKRTYFAQLAGAGLDARAIELVKWQVKKLIGPMAYVLAGLHAVMGAPAAITATADGQTVDGELVLIGNGRLYGGQFTLFPQADLRDGLLEICVLPKVNWLTLARCGPGLLVSGRLPASATKMFRSSSVTLTSPSKVPVEVDGELLGHLPATFSIEPSRLKVIVPG